ALVAEEIIADKTAKVVTSGEKVKTKSGDLKRFLGLFIFVAIPLPFTGVWTGSAIGAFLDMKLYKSASSIALGNIAAALILTLLIKIIPLKYIDIILYAFLALVLFSVLFTLFVIVSKYRKRSVRETA